MSLSETALHPSEAGLDAVAGQTRGILICLLKEPLFRRDDALDRRAGAVVMDAILLEQCDSLRHQMATASPEPSAEEKADMPGMPPWMRHLPRRPGYR